MRHNKIIFIENWYVVDAKIENMLPNLLTLLRIVTTIVLPFTCGITNNDLSLFNSQLVMNRFSLFLLTHFKNL